jgi:hypothetical protein
MLHVTNGDAASEGIQATSIGGDVLPWRDVLHEGPVPHGVTATELRMLRATFLARCGWATEREALAALTRRDQRLDRAIRAREEIVLWFEPDLYDQLQLLQVLDWLANCGTSVRVSAVLPRGYLGPMSTLELVGHFAAARELGRPELDLASRAWAAFRADDPRAIESLLRSDVAALPDLDGALRRHLEQFPSTIGGLSRSERQALETLAEGPLRFDELFVAAQTEEPMPFLGDAVLELQLAELAAEPSPLVEWTPEGFWLLTAFGRAVLAGEEDRVAVRGLDRWLGGVRLLAPNRVWRWDPGLNRLVPPPGARPR